MSGGMPRRLVRIDVFIYGGLAGDPADGAIGDLYPDIAVFGGERMLGYHPGIDPDTA